MLFEARVGKILYDASENIVRETRRRAIDRIDNDQQRDYSKMELMVSFLNLNIVSDFLQCLWRFGLNPALRDDVNYDWDVTTFVKYAINKEDSFKEYASDKLTLMTDHFKFGSGWKKSFFGPRKVLDQNCHLGVTPTSLGLLVTWYCFYIHKQIEYKESELVDFTYDVLKYKDYQSLRNKRAVIAFENEEFNDIHQICLSSDHPKILSITGLATQLFEPRRKEETTLSMTYAPGMPDWDPILVDVEAHKREIRLTLEEAKKNKQEKVGGRKRNAEKLEKGEAKEEKPAKKKAAPNKKKQKKGGGKGKGKKGKKKQDGEEDEEEEGDEEEEEEEEESTKKVPFEKSKELIESTLDSFSAFDDVKNCVMDEMLKQESSETAKSFNVIRDVVTKGMAKMERAEFYMKSFVEYNFEDKTYEDIKWQRKFSENWKAKDTTIVSKKNEHCVASVTPQKVANPYKKKSVGGDNNDGPDSTAQEMDLSG